jgi:hypothetical protein
MLAEPVPLPRLHAAFMRARAGSTSTLLGTVTHRSKRLPPQARAGLQ